MIYEIINPSDKYTIEAADLKIAAVASVLLGRGQYGLEPLEDGGERVPIFLFGGSDEWFTKHFHADLQTTLDDIMTHRADELADCFDSCLIGGLDDRKDYDAAIARIDADARSGFRTERHDRRRSSMNDIGGRAYAMAQALRENAPHPVVSAPQQVFGS